MVGRVEAPCDRGLVDVIGRDVINDEPLHRIDDLGTTAVVEGERHHSASATGGCLNSAGYRLLETFRELTKAPDHSKLYLILDERLRLSPDGLLEKRHEAGDFIRIAGPVLRREAVKREVLDTALARRSECAADGLDSRAMAGDRREMPLPRPAPIAVHHDREMPRDRGGQTERISFSFACPISSAVRMYRSVSFWSCASTRFTSSVVTPELFSLDFRSSCA